MRSIYKKALFTVLATFAILIYGLSQSGITFGGPKNDRGVRSCKTSENSLVTVGVTERENKGEDIYVVKTDLNGKLIWEEYFGGEKDDAGWDMVETDGGDNYLITGWSNSYSVAEDEDVILLKISKNGKIIWQKTLTKEGNERCWSIKHLSDNSYLLIGQSQDRVSRKMIGMLTKIDRDGNAIWQKSYGDLQYNRLFYGAEIANNSLLIAGIARKDSTAENLGWVLQMDSNGNTIKTTQLTKYKNSTTHGVLPIGTKKYLVYGYAQTDTAQNQRAIYLSMYNKTGKKLWENVSRGKNSVEHGIGATLSTSGSILVTGYSRPLNSNNWDGILYGFSKSGKMKWKNTFGGKFTDQPYSILEISPYRFLITGLTKIEDKPSDLWLVWVNEKKRKFSNTTF